MIKQFKKHKWDLKTSPTPMRPLGNGRWAPDHRGRGTLDLKFTHDNPPRLVFAECKSLEGKLSDAQIEELRRLRVIAAYVREACHPQPCPIGVFVFKPGSEELVEAVASGKVMVTQ